jgi:hypothetical protein
MLGWLRSKQTSQQHFAQAVTGKVVSIRPAEHLEDDGASFGIEILTVACQSSGKNVICATFSGEAAYGEAKAGQRVTMSYRSVLDESDYGTPHKVDTLDVLSLRLVKG